MMHVFIRPHRCHGQRCSGPLLVFFRHFLVTVLCVVGQVSGFSSRATQALHAPQPSLVPRGYELLSWSFAPTASCDRRHPGESQGISSHQCLGFVSADIRAHAPGFRSDAVGTGAVVRHPMPRRHAEGSTAMTALSGASAVVGQSHGSSLPSSPRPSPPVSIWQLHSSQLSRGRFVSSLGAFPFLGRRKDAPEGAAEKQGGAAAPGVTVDMDLYGLVGLAASAAKAEIESRFLQAEKDLRGLDGDLSVLRMLHAARDILTDDRMRAEYDSTGRVPANLAHAFLPSSPPRGPSKERAAPNGLPDDLATERGAAGANGRAGTAAEEESRDHEEQGADEAQTRQQLGLTNIFSTLFGGGDARRRAKGWNSARGNDVWASVTLGLSEIAVNDVEKSVTVEALESCASCAGTGGKDGQKAVPCEACEGRGAIVKTQRTSMGTLRSSRTCPDCRGSGRQTRPLCSDCSGSGRVQTKKALQVTIPAGVADRMRLRIKGQGDVGENGGEAGDLLLRVEVENDTPFRRESNNLLGIVRISYVDAILGLPSKEIDVIDGKARISILPGTQSGEKIVVKGRGTVDPDTTSGSVDAQRGPAARGDHIAVIEVELPKSISAEERQLLERLRELQPRP
ncbi:DnaJ C terminal region domain-containing protein [Besnoitia besnoiti]|uniref:DnaJ C terminal region domain-containing protein n=1 Tax=Besnoitia besnoiti TaxID=94643 RepID=A0A2A9MBE8_BESBE|nr:DnaJ C terminal region domain-containing protein [Besnoitia besnoiti]PFH32712.1 DnaJ C terminal region domain-containing protein [Besnoitia besnoiti]